MIPSWIDISAPLRSGLAHWPDQPGFLLERISDQERGDTATVSKLTLGAHAGTHLDGPAHFIRGGKGVDSIPPDSLIGPCRVIEIADEASIQPAEILVHRVRPGERILFKTRNSSRNWVNRDFMKDYVHLSRDAAAYLAERRVRSVGVDYLSVAEFGPGGAETHRLLLEAEICIIEGLDLSQISPGRYDLVCLPLRIEGGDGSPARAFVRPRETNGKNEKNGKNGKKESDS